MPSCYQSKLWECRYRAPSRGALGAASQQGQPVGKHPCCSGAGNTELGSGRGTNWRCCASLVLCGCRAGVGIPEQVSARGCSLTVSCCSPPSSAVTLLAPLRLGSARLRWVKIPPSYIWTWLLPFPVLFWTVLIPLLGRGGAGAGQGTLGSVQQLGSLPFPSLWVQQVLSWHSRGPVCSSLGDFLAEQPWLHSALLCTLIVEFLLIFYFQLPDAACGSHGSLQSALVTVSGCSVIRFLCFVTKIPTLATADQSCQSEYFLLQLCHLALCFLTHSVSH